jgi:AcrR family transcriptional regulator
MNQQPRKRDKEASKQALLRAALDAFSKYGYDASTTKIIAAEAGLNEQLITRYFGGKSGLLLAALAAFVDEEENDGNYPPAADGVEEELLQFLLHRHKRFLELQEFFRTFIPLSMRDASIRESMEPIVFRATTALRDRLSELQKRHLIRAAADLDAASLIVSGQSLHISFLLRVNTNLPDAHLRHLISEFAGVMARGLAPHETEGKSR